MNPEGAKKADIEYVQSNFSTHYFTRKIFGTDVAFSVLKMDLCLLIWIGTPTEKKFSALSLSLQPTKGGPSDVLSTKIFGPLTDIYSQALGEKLVKKLKKNVYISCNLNNDRWFPEMEKAIAEEINNVPEAF